MTTLYPPELLDELKDYHVFLDTGVFITASKSKSFVELLIKLKNRSGCSFTTIQSVLFEYTIGADSLENYNKKAGFLKSLVDNIDPLNFLNIIPDFYVVMAKINGQNKSQTDFLLASCLYNYSHVKVALISGDFKAYPAFIPRTHVLTVVQDSTNAVRNLCVYKFDRSGYAQAARNTLSSVV